MGNALRQPSFFDNHQVPSIHEEEILESSTLRAKLTSHLEKIAYLPVVALIFLQLIDGILTFIAISRYGIHAEGNPLLRPAMMNFGPGLTLLVAKTAAILLILTLATYTARVSWINKAFLGLCAIYICAAAIPWTVILLTV